MHSPSSFSALCVGSFKTFLSSLLEKIGSILPQKYQKCFFSASSFQFPDTVYVVQTYQQFYFIVKTVFSRIKIEKIKMVVVWPMVKLLQENYNVELAVAM